MVESPLRSVVKASTWRVVATLTTTLLVFLFTRRLLLSVSVGALELFCKFVLYYAHERVWNRVTWGRLAGPQEWGPEGCHMTESLGEP